MATASLLRCSSQGNCNKAQSCCPVIFQSLTATLQHYGFSAYSCGSNSNGGDARYLTITYSGLATSGCGEYKKHGQASRTYTIDPLTGLVCKSGDSAPSFWCSPGLQEPDQCSSTSRTWDCGVISDAEKLLNCNKRTDEEGNLIKKTLNETLSNSYSISDVESNVDALLAQNNITDSSIPPGLRGFVVTGTGHSIISWSASAAETSASFINQNGTVTKTKLRLKFTSAASYNLVTKDEEGNIISEETRQANLGEVIEVNPPSSPGYVSIIPSCPLLGIETNLQCNLSGSYTTRRKVFPEGVSCPPFIGPDCEEYNTKTVVSSSTSSRTTNGLGGSRSEDWNGGSTTETRTEQQTTKITVCGETTCDGNGTFEGSYQQEEGFNGEEWINATDTTNGTLNPCSGTSECTTEAGYGETYGPHPCPNDLLGANCGVGCNGSTSVESEEVNSSRSCFQDDGSVTPEVYKVNTTTSSSISVAGANANMTATIERISTLIDCPGNVYEETANSQCSTDVSYTNSDGTEEDSAEGQWDSETLPFCSDGQTEDCMNFLGCVERYKKAYYSTESSANISCTAKFSLTHEPSEPQYFNTWFHYYTVEYSGPPEVESHLGAIGCGVRTVIAYNTQIGTTTSTMGEISVTGPSIALSTSDNKTKCLSNVVAYTYAI